MSTDAGACAACGSALDPERYGLCAVCGDSYCMPCSRTHLCDRDCAERGCKAGLCIRVVEDGRARERFGAD